MTTASLAASLLAVTLLSGCAAAAVDETPGAITDTPPASTSESHTFTADVWADNWFALYANGELVGEDSVPITTERSFNKETITFEATYPLTLAIEAKDFMETESGLEYIGTDKQQMGDGGIIVQVHDEAGALVAATDDSWQALVVQRAPLDPGCESSANPQTDCEFTDTEVADDWTAPDFDTTGWDAAVEYSAADVGAKDGFDEVSWDAAASLVWAGSLTQDNIVLFRTTVG